MTKKEQAAMDLLRAERDMYKALRWTEEVKPDVPPPDDFFEPYSRGFVCVGNRLEFWIQKGISSTVSHATTDDYRDWPKDTTSQNPRWFHSTRSRALRAARHEMAVAAAKALAKIDREIAKWEAEESANGTQATDAL